MTQETKEDSKVLPIRDEKGRFPKGVSGNPAGRPKGSVSKVTILKQALEEQLREQAAPDMSKVMQKALELAQEGDRSMIKLLLELHMSKGVGDDKEAKEKVSINISTKDDLKKVNIIDGD